MACAERTKERGSDERERSLAGHYFTCFARFDGEEFRAGFQMITETFPELLGRFPGGILLIAFGRGIGG